MGVRNMTLMTELQSFYKAQKANNPWAIAWAIVKAGDTKPNSVNPLWTEQAAAAFGDVEKEKALAAKIAAGISNNSFNKSDDEVEETPDEEDKSIQKLSPSIAALAGWFLGGSIQDITRGMSQATPTQQREFERQVQQSMRSKARKVTKDSAMAKMQTFFQNDENDTYVRKTPVQNAVRGDDVLMQKLVSFPPFAGAKFDPTAHRWVQPKNYGQTYAARGGKKRVRGTGTGVGERSVSGHGKGRIRSEGAGRKFKTETDLAASRRKEGFTHGKQKG
jgi:hypothetical protein